MKVKDVKKMIEQDGWFMLILIPGIGKFTS
jgi:hypothetical protein